MLREILGGKIHSATLTETKLDYEGSCAVDRDLLDAAGIAVYERVHVYNITSGARLDTYAIPGKRGSGKVGLNGAAARLGQPGDKVIIVTFVQLTDEELRKHRAKVVLVDDKNRVTKVLEHKGEPPK
ncbi:MAG: aspartate 1-decarboxylase [Calditrichaeota bacterium]|nr:aspartate 1-decarboxylase [Calditrichota bacterium]